MKLEPKHISQFSQNKIFSILLATGFSIFLIQCLHQSYAVQYSNYSSDKYQIQFQYPSDWKLEEKASRVDEGPDIAVFNTTEGVITVQLMNDTSLQALDLRAILNYIYHNPSGGVNSIETRPIEEPSFTTIDNQTAGTFVFMTKEKYGTFLNYPKLAYQDWIVKTPNTLYEISYTSPTELFDNPEITEIRNHFINSIKFLPLNATQSANPSRLDTAGPQL
jgi:hypothetical protein